MNERGVSRYLEVAFVIVALFGYAIGLVYVYHTTGMNPDGISDQFRGSETEMKFGKSYAELLQTSHNHLFGMGIVFYLVGRIFAATSYRFRYKNLLAAEPLAGLLITIGCFFLVRYVSPAFSTIMLLSSGVMSIGFFAQGGFILFDKARGEATA